MRTLSLLILLFLEIIDQKLESLSLSGLYLLLILAISLLLWYSS